LGPEEIEHGIDPCEWVVLTRRTSLLGPITTSALWEPLPSAPDQPVWTDDSSSLVSTLTSRMFEQER
jgi:hypothetical protein